MLLLIGRYYSFKNSLVELPFCFKAGFSLNIYRPQSSLRRLCFTPVCLSTEGGGAGGWGVGIPACIAGLQAHTQGEVEG